VTTVLSSLTPNGEGVRSSSIESISLRDADVSDLFARCRFPELWYLHLSGGVECSSWECLGLHTAALTTLHLAIGGTSHDPTTSQILSIRASTFSDGKGPTQGVAFATFTAMYLETLPLQAEDKLHVDFAAFTPREQVVHFGGNLRMEVLTEIVPTMPRFKELHLTRPVLSDGFLRPDPDGPLAGKKFLPSLRHLHLEDVVLDDDDWSPLLAYLVYQVSGDQVVSLTLSGELVHICKDVVEDIKALVDEFTLDLPLDKVCPFVYCSANDKEAYVTWAMGYYPSNKS